jgi:tRNA threonylcarbamoyladenosine biosynthesis protein TsaE
MNLVIRMEEYRVTSRDERETIQIAQNLESEKFENMIICLEGDLGSGKTIFTKGFAGALGIDENITSPTFNIIKEYYSGEMPLFHMDVYRLDGKVDGVGIEDYFTKNGVVIIEWADTIRDYLPEERLDIRFKVTGEDSRVLIFKPHGEIYEEICEAIL